MKWNKFRLKTTTEAEDIVSSMLMLILELKEWRLRIKFLLHSLIRADVCRYFTGDRGG